MCSSGSVVFSQNADARTVGGFTAETRAAKNATQQLSHQKYHFWLEKYRDLYYPIWWGKLNKDYDKPYFWWLNWHWHPCGRPSKTKTRMLRDLIPMLRFLPQKTCTDGSKFLLVELLQRGIHSVLSTLFPYNRPYSLTVLRESLESLPCRGQRPFSLLSKTPFRTEFLSWSMEPVGSPKLRRCFFQLRRHLGPEPAELQILMFLLNFIRQSGICQVESRLVCIPAIGAPPGRTTWKPSQRWMFPTWNTMRSEFGSSLESKTCSSKNSKTDPEDTLKFSRCMFVSCRIHKGFGHLHLRLTLYVTWPCHKAPTNSNYQGHQWW